jgi:hypothetical protein
VADGLGGLVVVDVSNPAAPAITGTLDTPGTARGVAVAGSYAYVADQGAALQVISVANPAAPTLAGSAAIPGCQAVAVAGSFAYVVDGAALQVVDVSDPAAPVLLGSVDPPGVTAGVAVSSPHVYVATMDDGHLHVLPAQCGS